MFLVHLFTRYRTLILLSFFAFSSEAICAERWERAFDKEHSVLHAVLQGKLHKIAWKADNAPPVIEIDGMTVFQCQGDEYVHMAAIVRSDDEKQYAFTVMKRVGKPGGNFFGEDYDRIVVLSDASNGRWSKREAMRRTELTPPLRAVSRIGAISSDGSKILLEVSENTQTEGFTYVDYIWQTWDTTKGKKLSEGIRFCEN
jgi:hypothetical protein